MRGFIIYATDMTSNGMIYTHTKFHEDWYRFSIDIKIMSQKFRYCNLEKKEKTVEIGTNVGHRVFNADIYIYIYIYTPWHWGI
jgi:hypothetical protein